jgi:predicted metal-binding membrane protein
MFAAVTARAPDPTRARLAFLAGYLAVWTAFAAP